jgi:hypothetical protein
MEPKIDIDALVKKVIDERKAEEVQYHKERLMKLLQEKIELELRLLVVNKTLEQIDEFVKQNPHLQE